MSDAITALRSRMARGATISEGVDIIDPSALGVRDVVGAGRHIRRVVGGLGDTLGPLLDDRAVTDVLVNGPCGVWVDRGDGLELAESASAALSAEETVRALAVRLAAGCGQRLDDASPIVDGTFPSGVRLHAVLPPLGAEGTLISLRAHRPVAFSVEELRSRGMMPRRMERILADLVRARANVMISGATGSGKTTLLAAILGLVPTSERILVIEESAELRPVHPHVVHLQVRRANVQGAGDVSMSDLVRAAMRMRPDRLILGECRGAEVRDVLSALNTGHEGGWATIHANSVRDVPARLVALGALAGMGEAVVAAQAASAFDAVIHVERCEGRRRIAAIGVLERRGGELVAEPAVEGSGALCRGSAAQRLAERLGWMGGSS